MRIAIGSAIGALIATFLAPAIRGLFSSPTGGVGYCTVNAYPKGWDYAVLLLLIVFSAAGAVLLGRRGTLHPIDAPPSGFRRPHWIAMAVIFVVMLFVHDHPFSPMETFHEGEHLTPAFVLRDGGRPFSDIFFLHGLAVDGGLDALVLGDPPSPLRTRRLQTLLDAVTLALLVAVASEVTATAGGAIGGTVLSLCAIAAGVLPVFPYFRLMPVVVATFGLLRYLRTGSSRWLFLASLSATLGLLWSLDTGMYALAAVGIGFLIVRVARLEVTLAPPSHVAMILVASVGLPIVVLVAIGGDLRLFFLDSFVRIPNAIDAIWSFPAPALPWLNTGRQWSTFETARYYLPPLFYALLLATALVIRRSDPSRAARITVMTISALVLFRTAAGRIDWGHIRYAAPFLGIAVVAFVLEPLALRRKWATLALFTVPVLFFFEVVPNASMAVKGISSWPARQSHAGMAPFPLASGNGIYTSRENAAALAGLHSFVSSFGPKARFLDFSGERALYYLLQRRPPVRCPDISMLSSPIMLAEAMTQLKRDPPVCVIVEGDKSLGNLDGISNRRRVPLLAEWIDANYPRRIQFGRFIVAAR